MKLTNIDIKKILNEKCEYCGADMGLFPNYFTDDGCVYLCPECHKEKKIKTNSTSKYSKKMNGYKYKYDNYPFDVIDHETNEIIATIHMTQDEKGLHVSPEIYDAVKSKFKKYNEVL